MGLSDTQILNNGGLGDSCQIGVVLVLGDARRGETGFSPTSSVYIADGILGLDRKRLCLS